MGGSLCPRLRNTPEEHMAPARFGEPHPPRARLRQAQLVNYIGHLLSRDDAGAAVANAFVDLR